MSKTVASPRKTGVETTVGRLLPRDARTGVVAVPAPAQRPTHGTAATIRRVVRQVIAESAPRNG